MPIFEFECPGCKTKDEVLLSASEATMELDFEIVCESCDKAMLKVVSSGSFILKGEGFYKPAAISSKED